ncbi:hypothetical protein CR532_04865 (plasmid) [Candidatus Borreliella tachyglossi]|uniref:Uncharacterized protein n=1 Tax=Candidatus Borreliella tachyglossi TaxID=1964448 RepID=A0A2S1LYF0_9SPIR|nr:helix-turn-helix domain-containing protein [Candidatus Borreliella tachyglossi]AWG43333.1 hypothetical protein CR532_04865 [Candidatus Borreliella tachyglossi]
MKKKAFYDYKVLFDKGLKNKEIASILNVCKSAVSRARNRYKALKDPKENLETTVQVNRHTFDNLVALAISSKTELRVVKANFETMFYNFCMTFSEDFKSYKDLVLKELKDTISNIDIQIMTLTSKLKGNIKSSIKEKIKTQLEDKQKEKLEYEKKFYTHKMDLNYNCMLKLKTMMNVKREVQ